VKKREEKRHAHTARTRRAPMPPRLTRESLSLAVFGVLAAGTGAALVLTAMAKKVERVRQRERGEGGGSGGVGAGLVDK